MSVFDSLVTRRVLRILGGMGVVGVVGLVLVSPSGENSTLSERPPTTTATVSLPEPPNEELELTFDSAAQPVSTEVRLVSPGLLTACVDSPFPPFAYSQQSDGEDLSGIDIDLITAIASNNKLGVAFVETAFDRIFDSLNNGTCDVVAAAVPVSDVHKRAYEFTNPYFQMSQSLLVRVGDRATLNSIASLRGKKVGVQRATLGELRARELQSSSGFFTQQFSGRFELLAALRDASVDAIIGDVSANGFDAHESDGVLVVSARLRGGEENYAFVVSPTNPVLTKTMNDSLARLNERGLPRKIFARHIGDALTSPVSGE